MMKASSFSGSFLYLEPKGRRAKVIHYWVGRSSLTVGFNLGRETWIPRAAHTCQLLALVGISFTFRVDNRGIGTLSSVQKFFPMGLSANLTSD